MVPSHGAELRGQRGFTLIELMTVVAIIAILAIVVVPQFFGSSRKVKADSEISPMFAEISIRQEQWKSENGAYATLAACPGVTSPTGVAATTCTGSTEWTALRINAPVNTLRCDYVTTAGPATTVVTNPSGFTWSSPPTFWYYTIATCDTDGQTGTNATFFTSSSDAKIQKLNEGQ